MAGQGDLARRPTMRIIICGNAPWVKTGYGTQGRFLIKAFQELGHKIFGFPHFGLQGGPVEVDGVEYLPLHRDGWGHDIIAQHVRATRADCVLSFHDVWVLRSEFPRSLGVPWITYSPVDSIPISPTLVNILREAKHIVAMSRFGQDQMKKAGLESTYIPHAINTDIYCPGDKAEARRKLGIPAGPFICLIAAANHYYPSRKAFPEQMAAFAEFHKEFQDTNLLLHAAMTPTTPAGGLNLYDLVNNLGLGGCTGNSEDYDIAMGIPDDRMALMYRSADVLLGASYAEGFGLMQAEATACGTPVIVHDFAASPEFLFNGIKVPSAQRFWNPGACWQAVPSIAAITKALREIYLSKDKFREQGLVAAERMAAELSEPVVRGQYWKPFLEQVEDGLQVQTEYTFNEEAAHVNA